MKCGFYELDITPPLNSIIPGSFAARRAKSIRDKLYVRAFAAIEGDEALAIVSIDACGITMDITEKIRERVASSTPIKRENVMAVATHCHGGGPTLNWGEEVVRDPIYIDDLANKAADAIIESYRNACESELILGKEELFGYSFIRVYRMKDGSLQTNPPAKIKDEINHPITEIDPEVLVLAVKQEDRFVGAVVNFANHPAIVSKSEISGDYISELNRAMKESYGADFVTVFINGACGNINHVDPFNKNTVVPYREREVGRALAEKVQSAIENGAPMKSAELAATNKTITVHFRKPDIDALIAAKKVLDGLGDQLIESVPRTPDYQDTFFAINAFAAMADKRTQRELALQLFKVGDVYFAGTPCQIFVQFGRRIKEGVGAPCFVSAFANDYAGYVPTEECFGEKNVYEAKLCPTSALEPATGNMIVNGVLELFEEHFANK